MDTHVSSVNAAANEFWKPTDRKRGEKVKSYNDIIGTLIKTISVWVPSSVWIPSLIVFLTTITL